jgi:predicted DNA-binding WGR domain protein
MIDAITQCLLARDFCIRFEHTDGHYKFWEVRSLPDQPTKVRIRYGRIGEWGKTLIKDRIYFEKTAPTKLKKGYIIESVMI